ncbi:PIN domain-containing protein [Parafilimonas terrae]|uniref:PIN domain-containing protein n=1 Tax=Parafilimonas terrae TaxID=1465490 RepID=A0A1I5ZC07_9BACT|nr:PIN domain-containing protein [Parafilimonas terrae]SFQ53965.1 hypothetical protein SAMN05444277_1196 [Parafilimonas terrae]
MSGIKILADTNAIIYHLAGNQKIETILNNNLIYISSITYAQLLSKQYISSIHIIHTNDLICEIAAGLRKNFKIKLPDAIIAATSFFLNTPLITFDEVFYKIDDLKILKLDLS